MSSTWNILQFPHQKLCRIMYIMYSFIIKDFRLDLFLAIGRFERIFPFSYAIYGMHIIWNERESASSPFRGIDCVSGSKQDPAETLPAHR